MPHFLDLDRLKTCCHLVFNELGCMYVRAWPDPEEWLNDLSHEISLNRTLAHLESFVLTEDELALTLMPELTTVYTLRDATIFTMFVLASMRHSEFPAIFVSKSNSRTELVQLLKIGDYFSYQYSRTPPSSGMWLFGVGICAVAEEHDSLLYMCDSTELLIRINDIFREISVRVYVEDELDCFNTSSENE